MVQPYIPSQVCMCVCVAFDTGLSLRLFNLTSPIKCACVCVCVCTVLLVQSKTFISAEIVIIKYATTVFFLFVHNCAAILYSYTYFIHKTCLM